VKRACQRAAADGTTGAAASCSSSACLFEKRVCCDILHCKMTRAVLSATLALALVIIPASLAAALAPPPNRYLVTATRVFPPLSPPLPLVDKIRIPGILLARPSAYISPLP
jgi:hypothetical protein